MHLLSQSVIVSSGKKSSSNIMTMISISLVCRKCLRVDTLVQHRVCCWDHDAWAQPTASPTAPPTALPTAHLTAYPTKPPTDEHPDKDISSAKPKEAHPTAFTGRYLSHGSVSTLGIWNPWRQMKSKNFFFKEVYLQRSVPLNESILSVCRVPYCRFKLC